MKAAIIILGCKDEANESKITDSIADLFFENEELFTGMKLYHLDIDIAKYEELKEFIQAKIDED